MLRYPQHQRGNQLGGLSFSVSGGSRALTAVDRALNRFNRIARLSVKYFPNRSGIVHARLKFVFDPLFGQTTAHLDLARIVYQSTYLPSMPLCPPSWLINRWSTSTQAARARTG